MHILRLYLLSILLVACQGQASKQGDLHDSDSMNIEQRAQRLAKKFIITDGHIDVPYRLHHRMEDVSVRTEQGDFDYVRAREGGLDAPFMSIYVPSVHQDRGDAKDFADSMIWIVENMAAQNPDKFAIARSPQEVRSFFEQGIISLPMGLENGAPVMDDLTNLKYFYDRGIRYITLTHAKDNQICDSSYDETRTWNGLSPFGRQVVAEMNRLGIMVDVSHISDSAFYQVMEISRAPAIASHSSCRHFTPGWERNMSDDMIKLLAANGGVIQINFGSVFLDQQSFESDKAIDEHVEQWRSSQPEPPSDSAANVYKNAYRKDHFIYSNVARVADHIDHVVSLTSIDHVAFGSDFDGVGDSLPVGLKDVSQYPNLIAELLQRGYTEEDIEKICYVNVFRVWNEVAKIALQMQASGT